jgi:hypothetical protein
VAGIPCQIYLPRVVPVDLRYVSDSESEVDISLPSSIAPPRLEEPINMKRTRRRRWLDFVTLHTGAPSKTRPWETQGVTQGVTDCRIRQYYSYIYRLHDPNGLTTECRPLTFLQRSPHLFKPSSHTGRHRVGWHAMVCYGAPNGSVV